MTLTAAPPPDVATPDGRSDAEQQLHDIEAVITDAVLRRYPDAVAWSVTATNAASGRPGHFYFDEPVTVYTAAAGQLVATEIGLRGTPAAGAAYDLSRYVHAAQGVVHAVTTRKGPRP